MDEHNKTDIQKHSAAHVLAAAVKRLYPDVKIGIGPVTKDGFFYDFHFGDEEVEIELDKIEATAHDIVEEDLPFKQVVVQKSEAENMLLRIGQIFKAEIVRSLPDEEVSFYRLGSEFIDLCRGPHVQSTKEIGLIKIRGTEEVNWQDDPARAEMVRITGQVFSTADDFEKHIEEEERKEFKGFKNIALGRGFMHRVDGQFMLTEDGATLLNETKRHIYKSVTFPTIKTISLPTKGTAKTIQNVVNATFESKNRSYKQLPITYINANTRSGKADKTGINDEYVQYITFFSDFSAISFFTETITKVIETLNITAKNRMDAEIFCTDLQNEFVKAASHLLEINIISHDKILSQEAKGVCEIVLTAKTEDGNTFNLATISLDRNTNTNYRTVENEVVNPWMSEITFNLRDIFMFTIEQFQGKSLPFELTPVQITCIPTNLREYEYAKEVTKLLRSKSFRIDIDATAQSLMYKIRRSERKHIPFIFVIGQKESTNKAVSARFNGAEVGLVSTDGLHEFIEESLEKKS